MEGFILGEPYISILCPMATSHTMFLLVLGGNIASEQQKNASLI